MKIEQIREGAPIGAESYRIKGLKAYYYRNFYTGFRFIFQRWSDDKWEMTVLNDRSEIKPL